MTGFAQHHIALAVAAAALCVTLEARAGMKELFDSYQNDLGGYHVQTRNGNTWGAGQFSARWQQPNVDILSVQGPSMSAGCGGLDIFGGSFGLISGDELVQVGRAVAQGAASYFFKIAIANICSTCASEMENLQDKIRKLNDLARDACQKTENLLTEKIGPAEDQLLFKKDLVGGAIASANGTITSWSTGLLGDQNINEEKDLASVKEATEGNSVAAHVDKNTGIHSPFIKAIHNFSGNNKEASIAALMTFMGAKIVVTNSADGQPTISTLPAINYEEFILGGDDAKLSVYKCRNYSSDPQCLNVDELENTLPKVLYYARDQIIGDTGIFNALSTQGTLSEEARRIKEAFNVPFTPYLVESTRYNLDLNDFGELAALKVTQTFNEELYKNIKEIYLRAGAVNGSTYEQGAQFRNDYDEAFVRFTKDYQTVRDRISKRLAKTADAIRLNLNLIALQKMDKG
ncbi:conjugal transfer protein TraH [Pseudoalteromonas rubra]|uniref:Conjugal transfer protein TraH n=1 Tax=Pseudoalteromonas rubra TaxID=43658 RepID=A0A0U3IS29_9GAMM|nr:conjugal transfer protein TraH [Pseudoalteromonas rubra]ALU46140.1 hypothetical protein AT705_24570 [Pseudoalteromonas rubra]